MPHFHPSYKRTSVSNVVVLSCNFIFDSHNIGSGYTVSKAIDLIAPTRLSLQKLVKNWEKELNHVKKPTFLLDVQHPCLLTPDKSQAKRLKSENMTDTGETPSLPLKKREQVTFSTRTSAHKWLRTPRSWILFFYFKTTKEIDTDDIVSLILA